MGNAAEVDINKTEKVELATTYGDTKAFDEEPLTIDRLMKQSHETAVEKGWWEEGKERELGTQIALMHSELSEALEENRVHGMDPTKFIYKNEGSEKPEGIAVEFADILIRIGDTCQKYGIPLEEAIRQKMAYNKTRPYRHGNKTC